MRYLLSQTIEPVAQRTPDKPAFRFLDDTITYSQLSRRTEQLASVLIEQGVRRGDRVGIYLNKSLECAVAIYGIMKAGAAYVPLDAGAPPKRLASVIGNCAIRHLVTHDAKRPALQGLTEIGVRPRSVIGLSEPLAGEVECVSWDDVHSHPGRRPVAPPRLTEDDLAYIIFTSGSTGTPKGIMHSHGSGLAYARMAAHVYGVRAEDRLSNHSPLNFDMSTFDYFVAPLCGATTVIVSEMHTKLPASLSQLIEHERITIWYSVPHALVQLLLHGVLEERDLSALRWVKFGGEPFPIKHLRSLMQRLPGARFSNVYGPAEVNQCTYYHVPRDLDPLAPSVPIGFDCPNASGLVIDEDDTLVPPGGRGELVVRTATMMRGYWERPDLNERAFFRQSVTSDIQDLYYRTGDLVQLTDDRGYLLLGRRDRQIKTRGFRVELDEVEAALVKHEMVREAAAYPVTAQDDTVLVEAAVLPVAGAKAQALKAELQAHCAERLPAYAVPRDVLVLESFPRTTSSKIDRRSLRARAEGRLERVGQS